jgi:hypothetical protein
VTIIRRVWFQLIIDAKRFCCYEIRVYPCYCKEYYQADFKGNRETEGDIEQKGQIKRKQKIRSSHFWGIMRHSSVVCC